MTQFPDAYELKKMALEEYNSDVTTAHHGIPSGGNFWNFDHVSCKNFSKAGRPFWNGYATQFMFNPAFDFSPLPGCTRYRFTASDCRGDVHTFEADSPMSLLTPVWGDLPEGYVELKVEALNDDGEPWYLIGARTFYRLAPFAGPDAYPPKARSYRECVRMAFRFTYELPMAQYWLKHGTPDPSLNLNVYPSKMNSSLIRTMLAYASVDPEHAEDAVQIAKNAADYTLSITFGDESPLKGLPPTYYTGFREGTEYTSNLTADDLGHTVMMFYPAQMGLAYLSLEEVTGEERYFKGAEMIGDYYRRNVRESGSWPLVVSVSTGEALTENECMPDDIIPFLKRMGSRTGDPVWAELEKNLHEFRVRTRMPSYHWEGQFEDSPMSVNYSNLSHFAADSMICYIAENQADDPEAVAQAEDLMRFVEDQFVVWGKHAPIHRRPHDESIPHASEWGSPSALEQYAWYVPIDDSAAAIMNAFLALYKATGKPLLLAKACALADSITRMQNPKTGQIPTHWLSKEIEEEGGWFWPNCHNDTAFYMLNMANELE